MIGFDGSAVLRCALSSNFARALTCSVQSLMVTVRGALPGAPGTLDRSVNLRTVATPSFDGDLVAALDI
ncbi:hypothetical protein EMIT0P44_630019 [Pseudomonas sp. IT-P44]